MARPRKETTQPSQPKPDQTTFTITTLADLYGIPSVHKAKVLAMFRSALTKAALSPIESVTINVSRNTIDVKQATGAKKADVVDMVEVEPETTDDI